MTKQTTIPQLDVCKIDKIAFNATRKIEKYKNKNRIKKRESRNLN